MILRLGLVDLVDRCANSLGVQPVAILELSVLLGGAPFFFYTHRFLNAKRRAVCRRQRLHVTAFSKIAIFSLSEL